MSAPGPSGRATWAASGGASSRKRPVAEVAEPREAEGIVTEAADTSTRSNGAGSAAASEAVSAAGAAEVGDPATGSPADPAEDEALAEQVSEDAPADDRPEVGDPEVAHVEQAPDGAERASDDHAPEHAHEDGAAAPEVADATPKAGEIAEANSTEEDQAGSGAEPELATLTHHDPEAGSFFERPGPRTHAETVQDDPIDVASRFAAATDTDSAAGDRPAGPASPFGMPDALASLASVSPLAAVDELAMPEMTAVLPEPDLHLRPPLQPLPETRYGTVSALRRERVLDDPGAAGSATVGTAYGTGTEPVTEVHGSPRPVPEIPSVAERGEPARARVPQTPQPQLRRRPRRARLKVSRIDPWTAMKISFLFSLAIAIMTLVAVALLWSLLNSMGVIAEVGKTLGDVTGGDTSSGVDLERILTLSRVLKFTGIVAILQTIVLTCLATLAAFLYNASAGLVGGLEITLSEGD